MKRSIHLIFSAVVILGTALLITTSCTKGKNVPYKIACLEASEPFSYYDENGVLTGFEVELIQAIAQDQDISIELHPMDFEDIVYELAHYKPNFEGAIAMVTKTAYRAEVFDFSVGYFISGIGLAVKDGGRTFSGFDDLAGQKVGVKSGTFIHNYANMIADTVGFQVFPYKYEDDVFLGLSNGTVDVVMDEIPIINHRINKGEALQMAFEGQLNQNFGFIVETGRNGALLEYFNDGLENITEDGTYEAIYNKYFPEE